MWSPVDNIRSHAIIHNVRGNASDLETMGEEKVRQVNKEKIKELWRLELKLTILRI